MLEFLVVVKGFVNPFVARETSFRGSLSSPLGFLPSKDYNSCATS